MLRYTNRIFLALALVGVMSSGAMSRDIYSMIVGGEIEQAREALSKASTASQRDGNHLFFLSLIEPNAKKSFELMQASMRAGVSAIYLEEINVRMLQYYLLNKDFENSGKIITNYGASFENGKYAADVIRYSVYMDEKNRNYESAIRQADRLLVQFSGESFSQWGLLDKARIMMGFDKKIAARDILTKLSREKSGPGVPAALYLLTLDAADRNRTDDAVFYYNLMREAFSSAVGIDALLDRMAGLGNPAKKETKSDKQSGTVYSVQVGVFSSVENAKRLSREFEQYGHKVEIGSKKISDRTYHVVYVGRFSSYESAAVFEKTIEAEHNDVYQVVAR